MITTRSYRALVSGDFADGLLDSIALEAAMARLTDEEREIIHLWFHQGLNFSEIGIIIGLKYRDRELSGSGIRYLRDQILRKLREHLAEDV